MKSRIRLIHAILCLVTMACISATPANAQPGPPVTDRFSVQMFQGATQNCWIAVYPPNTDVNGVALPPGTPVTIKVYRSYDGGKTYGANGVRVTAMGEGKVGQGDWNGQEKEWIDCQLETPVDNQPPFAIWLAVTAVVNGQESPQNNRFLNFRYVDNGRPGLIRYETPDVSGPGVADELARPLPQEIAGRWDKDGEFVIRTSMMTPGMKQAMDSGQIEGCSAEMLKMMDAMKNKPFGMEMNVKMIDMVAAPGMGSPVNPAQGGKTDFPGELTVKIIDPTKPQEAKDSENISFNYNYPNRFIKFGQTKDNNRMLFGGHFFQNATDYQIFGTWRCIYTDAKMPGEWFEIRGTWRVSKKKPV